MRRIAALFKRNDKPAVATTPPNDARPSKSTSVKKPSRFFRSLSLKAVQPPVVREPPPSIPQPPPASSSSSSSTDSPAPATPDDDSEIGPSASHRRSGQWSDRKLPLPLPAAAGSSGWDPPQSRSLSIPSIPPITKSLESGDVDDCSSTSSSLSISPPPPVSPHASLHSLTTCALAPMFSAPPLLYLPDAPMFPRSTSLVSSLPHQETMVSTLHRTRIQRRLARRDLTASEERSVASFTSRRASSAKSQFLSSNFDDGPVRDARRVSNVSHGLKQWISRPCFEDRMSVYTPDPSRQADILVHKVSGGALGVAALEVSVPIELLAGYGLMEKSETPWPSIFSSSSTADLRLPAPATSALTTQAKSQPHKATPSPLRVETILPPSDHPALEPLQPSLKSSPSPVSPSTTQPVSTNPRPKRVRSSVRFDVEEKQDKDDHVPLAHIMRIKRGREDRAKFLELQKERRAFEEERIKHETEKKRWEQEKRAWEAERKAEEEEKKKRLYQQEVIAARKRRESQAFRLSSISSDLPEVEPQNSRRQGSYSRPAYDSSHRQGSDGSSAATQPPSRNQSFNSLRGTSRPQSLCSEPLPSPKSSPSTEDVTKPRERRISMFPATPPPLPMVMQPHGYPWGMPVMPQMQMQMQMVPQMPYYPMDNMPLLPPTAPFMVQQTGDRRRSTSSSANRSSVSLQKSATQSTDRLSSNQGASSERRSIGHRRSSSGGSNQFGSGHPSNQGSTSSRRSSGIVNDPNQRNSIRSRPSMPHSFSHGSGSWVVPSSVPRRLQNQVS